MKNYYQKFKFEDLTVYQTQFGCIDLVYHIINEFLSFTRLSYRLLNEHMVCTTLAFRRNYLNGKLLSKPAIKTDKLSGMPGGLRYSLYRKKTLPSTLN